MVQAAVKFLVQAQQPFLLSIRLVHHRKLGAEGGKYPRTRICVHDKKIYTYKNANLCILMIILLAQIKSSVICSHEVVIYVNFS